MQIGKIKPVATIVAQFAAGVEVEAIQHEGKLFLPITTMGEFATKESAPVDHEDVPESKPSKKADKESNSEATDEVKIYTEDELMEMDVKELKGILKSLEIDPDDFDGKNTNKKLRKLILDAQSGEVDKEEEDDDDDDDDEKPSKKSSKSLKSKKDDDEDEDDEEESDDEELTKKVNIILDEYDGGKINNKKATSKLVEILDGDKDAIAKMLDKFDDDEDGEISEWADKFVSKFSSDDDEDDEDENPAKKSKKKSKHDDDDDDDLVEISDLKKGDRVNVWWDDEDNKAWYKGTVKSVKGKNVTVAYDDDTEDVLDPENNTQIKLLDK